MARPNSTSAPPPPTATSPPAASEQAEPGPSGRAHPRSRSCRSSPTMRPSVPRGPRSTRRPGEVVQDPFTRSNTLREEIHDGTKQQRLLRSRAAQAA
jgi:hypothetical protein